MSTALARNGFASGPRPLRVLITSGGALWRRNGERIELCLVSADAGQTWTFPRGRVHEDERLEEAAIRGVYDVAGQIGRPQKQIARLATEDGEIAYLYLMRVPPGERLTSGTRESARWAGLADALQLVRTAAERVVVRRVAWALGVTIEKELPFVETVDPIATDPELEEELQEIRALAAAV